MLNKLFGQYFFVADGSCFTSKFNKYMGNLVNTANVDFVGADCDPVYKAVANQTHLFTCCRDGAIRKYNIAHLSEVPVV